MTFIKTDEKLADIELGMMFSYNHCAGGQFLVAAR